MISAAECNIVLTCFPLKEYLLPIMWSTLMTNNKHRIRFFLGMKGKNFWFFSHRFGVIKFFKQTNTHTLSLSLSLSLSPPPFERGRNIYSKLLTCYVIWAEWSWRSLRQSERLSYRRLIEFRFWAVIFHATILNNLAFALYSIVKADYFDSR